MKKAVIAEKEPKVQIVMVCIKWKHLLISKTKQPFYNALSEVLNTFLLSLPMWLSA